MANWKIIVSIIAGIIILLVLYFYFRKSPEKYIRKAVKSHKKGEEYYNLGDVELAEDYYKEAEHFRKKAKEMEAV